MISFSEKKNPINNRNRNHKSDDKGKASASALSANYRKSTPSDKLISNSPHDEWIYRQNTTQTQSVVVINFRRSQGW